MRAAKLIRAQQGKTLRQVEADTGINRGALSRFEAGAGLREDKLWTLARYLGVTIDAILAPAEQPEDKSA